MLAHHKVDRLYNR